MKAHLIKMAISWLLLFQIGMAQATRDFLAYDVFIFQDELTVDLDLGPLFTPELMQSIRREAPLHLKLMVELKKSLDLWFDPALKSGQSLITIEYEDFGSRFRLDLEDFNGKTFQKSYADMSSLREELAELLIISFGKLDQEENSRLYLQFALEVRRLTARDIGKAGGWYRGHPPGDSVEKEEALPERAFRQLLDWSGMGPVRYRFSSQIFRPSELRFVKP